MADQEADALVGVTLRPGTPDDVPSLLYIMDGAIEWLVSQGRTGQWGSTPASRAPFRIEQLTSAAHSGGLWVALTPPEHELVQDTDDLSEPTGSAFRRTIIGAVAVGEPKPWAPPATEPELYVRFMITHRAWKGRRLGELLLAKAKALAGDAGVSLLRVDCYAGGDGKLVRWYESQGFRKTETFDLNGWPGQYLTMRLDA